MVGNDNCRGFTASPAPPASPPTPRLGQRFIICTDYLYDDKKKVPILGAPLKKQPEKLLIYCRDFRVFHFGLRYAKEDEVNRIVNGIIHHTLSPKPLKLIFLFSYTAAAPRYAATSAKDQTVLFEKHKDWQMELDRTKGNVFYKVFVNETYEGLEWLPPYFIVPAHLPEESVYKFHGRGIPIWCWSIQNGAALFKMASLPKEVDDSSMQEQKAFLNGVEKILHRPPYEEVRIEDLSLTLPSLSDIQAAYTRFKQLFLIDRTLRQQIGVRLEGTRGVREKIDDVCKPRPPGSIRDDQNDRHPSRLDLFRQFGKQGKGWEPIGEQELRPRNGQNVNTTQIEIRTGTTLVVLCQYKRIRREACEPFLFWDGNDYSGFKEGNNGSKENPGLERGLSCEEESDAANYEKGRKDQSSRLRGSRGIFDATGLIGRSNVALNHIPHVSDLVRIRPQIILRRRIREASPDSADEDREDADRRGGPSGEMEREEDSDRRSCLDLLQLALEGLDGASCDPVATAGVCRDNSTEFWVTDFKWFSLLHTSNWLEIIRQCLKKSIEVIEYLENKRMNVILKEDTASDFCCVISSLVQIMMDPHYRTRCGFQCLIQKEWVMGGHNFLDRCNHLRTNDGEAPVFLLFLDCVWQLVHQYPLAFEFSETYLTVLSDSINIPIFSTFFFNSAYQRDTHKWVRARVSKLPVVE
ncbi:unnamed protein product [Ranitomeya imitator]|uniref:Myotubularin phosphatase domain-containing protein n=1 Tax=Ranitomeya imitator TaxID=111125 RepID=A0ABN9M5C5_9NEOB|nr:unnamed protein product [Ranitomeya imitator]